MTEEQLDNLNDRHTPYAHVTGWEEPEPYLADCD